MVGVLAVLLAVLAYLWLYVFVDLLAELHLSLLQRFLLTQLLVLLLDLLDLVYLRHHLLKPLVVPQGPQLPLSRAVVYLLGLALRRAQLLKLGLSFREQIC